MRTVDSFPRPVKVLDPVFIPLSDGTKLAARIWLPEDAEDDPVPAILEYLPYRRQDGTAARDALTHPYFAGHGYASVRVDMRGSGDSEGVLLGEYLRQEQDDALEVIDWIAAQPWCTGKLGMIGISWGGFNGLQVAARRPSPLKAIVSICSTDDRYADDIHYMGGAMLCENAGWNGFMFSLNTTPPDPEVVGANWRQMWMSRVTGSGLWLEDWLEHQTRDEFYRHGSVCEDIGAIEAAVYAVGGWADGYSNAVFRLLSRLQSPAKGLVGPWAHKYPHFAKPGPQIGFLQECLRWWDHWLKDKDTGIMDEPRLRAWLEDPVPPQPHYDQRPGRWVAEASWPSPRIASQAFHLSRGALSVLPPDDPTDDLAICSPTTVGMMGGIWCAHGLDPDLPGDQRAEAGGSLVFETGPLDTAVEILGAPVLEVEVSSDKPQAMLAAVLSSVLPNGAATRVSFGLLNLSHRQSHEHPSPLEPGKPTKVRLQLNDAGARFEAGHRIRLALSTAYWPIAWPSPQSATLTVSCGPSRLHLPVRPDTADDAALRPFEPAEAAPPLDVTVHRPPSTQFTNTRDMQTGEAVMHYAFDEGRITYNEHSGWTIQSTHDEVYTIHPDTPLSAKLELTWTERFERGDWVIASQTHTTLTATETHFMLHAKLEAWEGETLAHEQSWTREFPRNCV